MAFEPIPYGDYVLTAHLGHGGMADVYRARRQGPAGFERTVVIKRILEKHHADPRFVQMFINEAKLAARLQHPNIAAVHELGEHQGEFFMVLEYVQGKDLVRILRTANLANPRHPSLPQPVAAYIAREMCRGLSHAHDHRASDGQPRPIVHRDVSPQNVMVSYDGHVKLVDFGIAKALDSMKEATRTGVLKGKFAYMAPEQVNGAPAAPAADIFSVGVILHEMLTGKRLFKGETDFDTLSNVKNLKIRAPSEIAAHVSPELDGIVARALHRDPAQRTPRAAQLARDLDVYLASARFTVEDMAEYLARLFPPDLRDDPAEVSLTPRVGSHKSAPTATPIVTRSDVRKPKPWWIVGGAALLGLGAVATWVVVERAAARHEPKVTVMPLVVPPPAVVLDMMAVESTSILPLPSTSPSTSKIRKKGSGAERVKVKVFDEDTVRQPKVNAIDD